MVLLSKITRLLGLVAVASSIPFQPKTHIFPYWPESYIALGDSYAAGIGAGHYVNSENNSEARRCRRFDGSYPVQVKGLLKSIHHFDFVACTGNTLADLEDQYDKLGDKRADLITLSVSGNDFHFEEVIESCIYNVNWKGIFQSDSEKDKACDHALKNTTDLVDGGKRADGKSVWTRYEEAVDRIVSERLSITNPSILVITGYAQFFATPEVKNDTCHLKRFPTMPGFPVNILRREVRQEMNELVVKVNNQIRTRIASRHPEYIRFLDIDDPFRTHRFCEPIEKSLVPGGVHDDTTDVYFISLKTTLDESSLVAGGDRNQTNEIVRPQEKPRSDEFDADVLSSDLNTLYSGLHKSSVFHPKAQGHSLTAKNIKKIVLDRWEDDLRNIDSQVYLSMKQVCGSVLRLCRWWGFRIACPYPSYMT